MRTRFSFGLTSIASSASVIAIACLALLLQACGDGPGRGLSWSGRALPMAERTVNPSAEVLRAAGVHALLPFAPRNLFTIAPGEWGDSLRLLEFAGELEAYAAFQELASVEEDIAAGTTVHSGRVCFRRGRWIGTLDAWSWKGSGPYDTALVLPDAPMTAGLPAAFGSMLHQGRLPRSERVLTRDFMGLPSPRPVLAVAMDCRGDTARLYAAPGRTYEDLLAAKFLTWREELPSERVFSRESRDFSPAYLMFSGHGAVGVEGCFDKDLTFSWIKFQNIGLKSIGKVLKSVKPLSFD